jgi:hypothetical protein
VASQELKDILDQLDTLELENRALRIQNAKQLEVIAQKEQANLALQTELADLKKFKAKIVDRAKALLGPTVQM